MPFDGTITQEPIDLNVFKGGREGLKQLSQALRQDMPEGFTWDYATVWEQRFDVECGTVGCALGLASTLWPVECGKLRHLAYCGGPRVEQLREERAASMFGMHVIAFRALFLGHSANRNGYEFLSKVPVTAVADAIDRYLETGEVRFDPPSKYD